MILGLALRGVHIYQVTEGAPASQSPSSCPHPLLPSPLESGPCSIPAAVMGAGWPRLDAPCLCCPAGGGPCSAAAVRPPLAPHWEAGISGGCLAGPCALESLGRCSFILRAFSGQFCTRQGAGPFLPASRGHQGRPGLTGFAPGPGPAGVGCLAAR